MSSIDPPRLPAWMLEHLNAGNSNEALAGDLVEEVRCGRSAVWYWRQVLGALVIGWLGNIRCHRNLVVFAALWSMLAPGWTLVAMRVAEHEAEAWHIWRLDWPWSSLCSTALFFAPSLIFIWVGMAFYIVAQIFAGKHFNLRRMGRGLLLGTSVFIAVSAALAGSVMLFQLLEHTEVQQRPMLSIAPAGPSFVPKALMGGPEMAVVHGKHSNEARFTTRVQVQQNPFWAPQPFRLERNISATRPLSPLGAITEGSAWAVVNRLPFFLSVLFALWTIRRFTNEIKSIAR